jgi:hypothetical protein
VLTMCSPRWSSGFLVMPRFQTLLRQSPPYSDPQGYSSVLTVEISSRIAPCNHSDLDKSGHFADIPIRRVKVVRVGLGENVGLYRYFWSHPSDSNRRPADYERLVSTFSKSDSLST